MANEKLRINYDLLSKVREAKAIKTSFLNINYELLGKILEAKSKHINQKTN